MLLLLWIAAIRCWEYVVPVYLPNNFLLKEHLNNVTIFEIGVRNINITQIETTMDARETLIEILSRPVEDIDQNDADFEKTLTILDSPDANTIILARLGGQALEKVVSAFMPCVQYR